MKHTGSGTDEELIERGLNSKEIFCGRVVRLYVDEIELPDGAHATREHLRHNGAACVVPLTAEGDVLMVRQWRYPMGEVTLEIPAGKLDSPSEDPLAAAKRELREETGAAAGQYRYLGRFYPACAYSNEVIHMYLATDLSFGKASPDDDEFIYTVRIPLKELVRRILREGDLPDAKTQAAILKTFLLLQAEETGGQFNLF